MRRDPDGARERLEYVFERYGGDPELLFDSAPGPDTHRVMLRIAECLLRTGDNELADSLIRCVAEHSEELELEPE